MQLRGGQFRSIENIRRKFPALAEPQICFARTPLEVINVANFEFRIVINTDSYRKEKL